MISYPTANSRGRISLPLVGVESLTILGNFVGVSNSAPTLDGQDVADPVNIDSGSMN